MNSRENPTDLTSIQRWMQSVIMHPEGVEAGIDAPASRNLIDVATGQVDRVICRSAAQSSIERLHVYANAYYARLLEVLASEYPALVHALGAELFQEFAFGYLQEHPSHSYTLSDLSTHFPEHLATTRPARDSTDPDWADFLIDLAMLERTYSEVFDGPGVENSTLLSSEQLGRIAPDQWPGMKLIPVPCLRLLALRFEVHEYVTAVRRQEEPELPAPSPTWLVITRRNYVVRRVAVQEAEFSALTALLAGEAVVDALAAAERRWRGPSEDLPQEVRRWFRDWAAAGYFLGIVNADGASS